jgi:hypothetical protein
MLLEGPVEPVLVPAAAAVLVFVWVVVVRLVRLVGREVVEVVGRSEGSVVD